MSKSLSYQIILIGFKLLSLSRSLTIYLSIYVSIVNPHSNYMTVAILALSINTKNPFFFCCCFIQFALSSHICINVPFLKDFHVKFSILIPFFICSIWFHVEFICTAYFSAQIASALYKWIYCLHVFLCPIVQSVRFSTT